MTRLWKTENTKRSLQSILYSYIIGRIFQREYLDRGDILQIRKAFHSLPYPSPDFLRARHPELSFANEKIQGLDVEWVSATDRGDAPIIIYLHGGGYMMGGIATHRIVTSRLARYTHGHVLALDYRLAPEFPFPAALEDAVSTYQWLLARRPASSLYIAGDSAGGGLALAALLAVRDRGIEIPAGGICFSPWTDLAVTGLSITENRKKDKIIGGAPITHWAKTYLCGADPKTPLASPLYGELWGLPPLLLHASSSEALRDDTIRFAEKARRSGVHVEMKLWRGVQHVWQAFPQRGAEVHHSFSSVAAFVRQMDVKRAV